MKQIKTLAIMWLAATTIAGLAQAQTNQITNLTSTVFMRQAAASFRLESALGLLAETKSQNITIQQFGQRLYVDDFASLHAAQTLATSQGIRLRCLTAGEVRIAQGVAGLTGIQFDRGFIAFVITNNIRQINLFEQASTNLINPVIRTFAAQEVPLLWYHLILAIDIGENLQPPVTLP